MSKYLPLVGSCAAALLVASAGTASAQSDFPTDLLDPATLSSEPGDGTYLGEAGELLPASVTGSLPGYATGPLGSVATLACNVGSAVSLGATVTATPLPLPVPIGVVCMVAKPVLQSGDFAMRGDAEGSVGAILEGIPLVGGSIGDVIDTSPVVDAVSGVLAGSAAAPAI